MRLPRTRRSALAATALAACLLSAALVPAGASARGGLAVTPGILEAAARPGGIGGVKITNTTRRPMAIGLAVRPWRQSQSGEVTPNRRRVLGKVRPNRGGFTLRAGASRTVPLSLTRLPARRSLYGAIEVTGAPKRGRGKGVRVAYRLVSSLRLIPPAGSRVFRPRVERLFQFGSTRRGALFAAVRNAGNTIDPIGATVRIAGRGRVVRNTVDGQAILPGNTVNLRLLRLRGTLPRGRYRVTVRLTQVGRVLATFRRGLRLR